MIVFLVLFYREDHRKTCNHFFEANGHLHEKQRKYYTSLTLKVKTVIDTKKGLVFMISGWKQVITQVKLYFEKTFIYFTISASGTITCSFSSSLVGKKNVLSDFIAKLHVFMLSHLPSKYFVTVKFEIVK